MKNEPFSAPYRSFLDQTKNGDSRWWTWLVGFWFAVTFWFYSQLALSYPFNKTGKALDPEGSQKLAEMATSLDLTQMLSIFVAFLITVTCPIAAAVLWLLQGRFSKKSKKTALRVAGVLVTISAIALIYMIRTSSLSSDGQLEIINGWIGKSSLVYLLMLIAFPPLAIGLWLAQKHIHKRTILSLHTAAKKFRWQRLFFSMGVFWTLALAMSYIGHTTGASEAEFVFDGSKFWKFLPVTLLFIPLQSATEEIALRGYLNQGLGHFIKYPIVVFVITSAAFASLHLGNPEVAETTKESSTLVAMSGYFLFGMFACLLTYIDGGLETAIGVHAANNMFAAAFMGYESSALPTPTVFRVGLNTQLDTITTVILLSLICLIMYVTRKPFERSGRGSETSN